MRIPYKSQKNRIIDLYDVVSVWVETTDFDKVFAQHKQDNIGTILLAEFIKSHNTDRCVNEIFDLIESYQT